MNCACKFKQIESCDFVCVHCHKIIKSEHIEIMLNFIHRNIEKDKDKINGVFDAVIDYTIGLKVK